MKKVLLAVAVWLVLQGTATALPVSNFTYDSGTNALTLNMYETDSSGNPSDTSSTVDFSSTGVVLSAAFLVPTIDGNTTNPAVSDYAAILDLIDRGDGGSTSAILYSGSEIPIVANGAAFQAALNDGGVVYEAQTLPPPTTLTISGTGPDFSDTFNIYAPTVPEPSTWLLAVCGCVGFAGYAWRRQRKLVAVT